MIKYLNWGLVLGLAFLNTEIAEAAQSPHTNGSRSKYQGSSSQLDFSSSKISKESVSKNNLNSEAGFQGSCQSPALAVYSTADGSSSAHQQEPRRQVQIFEAARLDQEGIEFYNQADYPQALARFERSLAIREDVSDRHGIGESLNNIGFIYDGLGDYAQALDHYQRSLLIREEIGDSCGKGVTLRGIGLIYSRLGEYAQALAYYQRALSIQEETGDRRGAGRTLNGIGFAYTRLSEYMQALNYYQRSLAIRRETGDRRGEGVTLNSIGFIYFRLGEYVQALDYYKQSLAIREEIGDRRGKGVTLNYIGQVYSQLGNHVQALNYYERSLGIRNEIGDRAGEAIALSNIGEAFISQGQSKLAIIFLKRSVNEYEKIRGSLADADDALYASYTDSIADTYRKLADLLLQQDRVLEAQHVLDLLKVQELDDYLQNIRGDAYTASGIEYYQPEQEILNRYNALQASAIEVGQKLAALNRKDQETNGLTDDELAQRNQLYQLDKEIRQQFNTFADSPEIRTYVNQIAQVNGTLLIEEITGLTDKLSDVNAVLIYPLVLDDRIELIITTPDSAPLRRTIKGVSRQELNQAIATFRTALSNPYRDVKTPAYQLYRWLIEPLEADLADAEQKTILYAPDGPLRYVPLAALYDSADADSGQWLAERFQINNITTTSLQEIATQPAAVPRILAGAFADENIIHFVEMGNRVATFQGLPFAGIEVATLADTLTNINTYLDEAFSLTTLEPQLNNFNILHFATHASLVPGDVGESFILFGDGESPTIRDIASWNLSNVDLVVLSACETGLGGFDNNGEQILGLGYQFQQIGARAVVASLWQVDDGGTQALMNAFYLALRNGFSKTEALQRSQQALIKNDLSFVGERQGEIQSINAAGEQPVSLKGTLDHPYYWAPFILIGNGL